jgi:ABC-type nitrate/sulfonate/bicarbonate transport system ATPase subunit
VLVGRDRELGVMRDALARVRAERSPQLVTLVGVPGIGKSRLLFELRKMADAEAELITWRQGRSLPYGEGAEYNAQGYDTAAWRETSAAALVTDSASQRAQAISSADPRGWWSAFAASYRELRATAQGRARMRESPKAR